MGAPVRSALKPRALAAGLQLAWVLWCAGSHGAPAATSDARGASEIARLEQRVELLYAEGQVLRAIPLAEQLLAATERQFGPDHEATALRLADLAGLFYAAEKYSDAAPLFERSIAIYERRLGARHPDTAAVVASLAALRRDTGHIAEAESLYRTALAIFEEALGPDDPLTATAGEGFALLYMRTGRRDEAGPLFERALAAKRQAFGAQHPETAATAANLGALYYARGEYGKAVELLGEALAIRERALGAKHPDLLANVYNLAAAYRDAGDLGRAAALFERAWRGFESAYGGGHSLALASMESLAAVLRETGAYDRSEYLYRLVLAIRESKFGPEHPDTVETLARLGAIYRLAGALAKAEATLQRVLQVRERGLGADQLQTANAAESLALVYLDAQSYARAETLLRRALAVHETVLGPDHADTAATRANLAQVRWRRDDADEAQALYLRALPSIERARGASHPATATILHDLGVLYTESGAVARAEAPLRRALEIRRARLGPEHPHTAASLAALAGLHWRQRRWAEAGEAFGQAAAIEAQQARRMFFVGDESRKLAYAEMERLRAYERVNFALDARRGLPAAPAIGLDAVLRDKGRVLDVMAHVLTQVRRLRLPPEMKLVSRLREANAEYAALGLAAGDEPATAEHRERLSRLRSEIESIETQLSEGLGEQRRPATVVNVEAVQRVIPPDAVLVEYFRYRRYDASVNGRHAAWGAPRYAAFVLPSQGAPSALDLGDAEAIERDVGDLLAALRDPSRSWFDSAALDLERKLVAPLRAAIGPATHVLVSPDGQLNQLPFGALRGSDGSYLAQRWRITYLTSGRDLLTTADQRPAPKLRVTILDADHRPRPAPPVVIANPDFGPRASAARPGMPAFGPLPGTAAEAAALAQILNLASPQVLTGADAAEAALKRLSRPRILHIASHGFFLPDRNDGDELEARAPITVASEAPLAAAAARPNPLLRSGIALAGANATRAEGEDGFLTALEAAGLDLDGTELVVLSACETGVGDVHNGEGVFGLRRALTLAGVRTQVASLWKVDDAATRDLMVDFYRRLQAGEGKSEALRAAQLAMLEDPRRRHPYYWAAFIAIGDAGPMAPP